MWIATPRLPAIGKVFLFDDFYMKLNLTTTERTLFSIYLYLNKPLSGFCLKCIGKVGKGIYTARFQSDNRIKSCKNKLLVFN